MIRIPFTKAHGTGNDFLILEASRELPLPSPPWRRRLCDRRYGIGADGILFLSIPATQLGADAELRVFNSDGGEAEISGNGTRCAAAYLVHTGRGGPKLTIQTPAGRKTLTLLSQQENRFGFEMAMGDPVFSPSQIPFQPSQPVAEPVIGFPLPLSSGSQTATVASMGNPHCSIAVEDFDWDWKALGAEIERHPFFPNRTNVEFYRIVSEQEIEVRYWERGVGVTLSSGTGSCAAAVAAILNQKVRGPVTVRTLGGDLSVRWDPEGVFLTGPAEIICEGECFGREEPAEFPATIPPEL
ncbi:MAG: diaminopimelate epimerase [Acidobacteria bacterium]|nr:diaminopimelate epimerase [Acidobacteriota bacterium]